MVTGVSGREAIVLYLHYNITSGRWIECTRNVKKMDVRTPLRGS